MRVTINKEYRCIRLWTSQRHCYSLSFKHPKYQAWLVCICEEWWVAKTITEFARVIWAK